MAKELTLVEALADYIEAPNSELYFCQEGSIRFYEGAANDIAIYYISIKEEHRRKGIFTAFIKHIITTTNCRRVIIVAMSTDAIIDFAKKFKHEGIGFVDHGGDALWARDKDYCKCCLWNDKGEKIGKKPSKA